MTPEPKSEVLDYIRANHATYTRAAIERELREAGHSQEAIDAAWLAFPSEGGPAATPPQRAFATVQFWVLLVIVTLIALFAIPFLSLLVLSGVLSLAFSSSTSGPFEEFFESGVGAILLLIAPFLLGYLAIGLGGWWLLRRDRAAAYGVFSGLVVAFVLSVIVAGTCVAIIQQM